MVRKLKIEILKSKLINKKLKKSKETSMHLLEQARHREKHFRRLAREILLAQEKERKQISRELHEGIAQTLAGINLYLETLKEKNAVSSSGVTKKISLAQRLVEQSMKVVLRFAHDLRPTLLDDLGLFPALHSCVKDFEKRTQMTVKFKAFPNSDKLNNIKRTVFFRAAQTVLANIAQHAQATHVEIKIQKKRRFTFMEIKDNRKNIQSERLMFSKKGRRLGLHSLREYVEMVGGRLSVKSLKGKGTTVCVEVPSL